MKKKVLIPSIIIAVLVLAGFVGTKLVFWYIDNKASNFTQEAVIEVYGSADPAIALKDIVDNAGVVRVKSLERAFRDKKVDQYIQKGHYVVKPGQSSVYVARMLNNCWQTPVNMVLSGTIRTNDAIVRKIDSQMLVTDSELYAALNDNDFLAKYGYNTGNVFSLFIPDTYEMYWTASIDEIFQKMKDANDAFWTEENLQKARKQGLTREEVSILASIVQGETNYEPEMPKVAGVYLNRLHIGMLLQADPTVAFCFNYEPTRILNRHLEVDSPYNTYKYAGLPPGPICVPSKAALNAVLNPDGHDWLYFCANSDFSGTHKFASSLSEHMKNARAFQAELNRRQASR